jgi:hypothetical protein
LPALFSLIYVYSKLFTKKLFRRGGQKVHGFDMLGTAVRTARHPPQTVVAGMIIGIESARERRAAEP